MFDSDPHPGSHSSDSPDRSRAVSTPVAVMQHQTAEQAFDLNDGSGPSVGLMLTMALIMLAPGFLLFVGGLLWLL